MPEGLSPVYSARPAGPPCRWFPPTAACSPGGTTFRNGTQLNTRVYDAETGKAAGPVLDPAASCSTRSSVPTARRGHRQFHRPDRHERNARLFDPDGKAGNVQLWDWRTGKRLVGPIPTPSEPRGLAFRPDGRTLAVVCADYRVVLVDPDTGTITHQLDPGIRTRP